MSVATASHSSRLMPTIKTGFSVPHKRAVAAAIPDDPVTRRTSFTVYLFKQMFQTEPIGFIKCVQLLGRAGVAEELMAGQNDGFHTLGQQGFGHSAADHV